MLFNSYEFLFAFLPITLVVFLLLGLASRDLALGWLIAASVIFYAWWRPINVPIIGVSLAINFTLARLMQRLAVDERRPGWRIVVLVVGIAFNVCFLGYFKYTNFILTSINDVAGTDFVLTHIVLPLGISFITFQKIAFLVDVQAGRVESFTLRDYLLFVLFFPQLIAGPIVHYREMMPQFHRNPCRFDKEAVSVGLTMIAFGLFKKVVLADLTASFVTPIYTLANSGATISLLPGWAAAIGFSLQVYFDFSGYSDMAAGLARCFGITLPLNFYSPLQATSVIDFWSRWHVTLTRFLTAYLYNPLSLALTRRRLAKGLPGLAKRHASLGAFWQVLAGPTVLTMFISGLWHGAGYLFVLWGLLHGLYLVINHAWRFTGARLWASKESYARFMRPVGFVLTFFSVVIAMVVFRAPTWHAAVEVFQGMFGHHGVELPQYIFDKLWPHGLPHHLVSSAAVPVKEFALMYLWLLLVLLIALVLPNSIQIMARYEPVLGAKERPANTGLARFAITWNPTLTWAIVMAMIATAALLRVGGHSEFLYWQF
ncbi:MAG TPA: MBOAT family O-acyltransferase [Steroidobacteraceae bacterium]